MENKKLQMTEELTEKFLFKFFFLKFPGIYIRGGTFFLQALWVVK